MNKTKDSLKVITIINKAVGFGIARRFCGTTNYKIKVTHFL